VETPAFGLKELADQAELARPWMLTQLESELPIRELSMIAAADKRSIDPTYSAHRWWARRPPAIMRGLLLAAALSANTSIDEFWKAFASPTNSLAGLRVHDPFVGGGSTLVEAARLGADVSGGDIDPLAVEIVRHELMPAPAEEISEAGEELLSFLRVQYNDLYPSDASAEMPLHYFWLHEVTCPACDQPGLLYRNLILVRDIKKHGAVVRDHPLTVFCPADLSVHDLVMVDQRELNHGGHRWNILDGTFTKFRYICPNCGRKSKHSELRTGVAPRRLAAVEVTVEGQRRRLRAASPSDYQAVAQAGRILEHASSLRLPRGRLTPDRYDDRPICFGIETAAQLFSDRQLVVFGAAMAWIHNAELKAPIKRAITLAISNALATNNKLCGYATDYGRLAALFSVRGFPLPALPVELNPLHPGGGRGTLRHCIDRVVRSSSTVVQRYVWSVPDAAPKRAQLSLSTGTPDTQAVCVVSAADQGDGPIADLCIFDPPYFDYIAYSELSEFYRAWHDQPTAARSPLLPHGDNPAEQFGLDFADCLRATLGRLAQGRPLVFTYHSADPDAWHAIGVALDDAKLAITGLWPVRSDEHMGHHSQPGNCEWDLVVCCRRTAETTPAEFNASVEGWISEVRPLTVSESDKTNMTLAHEMARWRFAVPSSHGGSTRDTRRTSPDHRATWPTDGPQGTTLGA
jgi:putative DNA methylase